MRKFTLLLFMLAAALTISAVPARSGQWRTLTLADGTTIKAMLVGDEYNHWYVDANGTAYTRNAAGIYQRTNAQTVAKRNQARRMQAAAHFASRRKADISGSRGDFKGTQKGLIILVNFADKKFETGHDKALYEKIANQANYKEGNFDGSIKDYFSDQSDGRFTIDFDIVGPVTMPKNYAYYGGNDNDENDLHPAEMVAEACKMVDNEIDFSKYDWGGIGEVDQIYVIYAGMGEADGGDDDTIWPHAYALSGENISLNLDGVKIDSYACSAEQSSTGIDGIGTICHEFSHCLGYPDLYDVDYGGCFGMSYFDLMASGSYNNNGFTPAGYTAYEKWIAGWLDYEVLDEEDVDVTNLKPTSEGGKAYVLYNKGNKNEYFVLENRQETHWDKYIPTGGLQVLHIDYDPTVWTYNLVNSIANYIEVTNTHQRLTLVHADNDDDSKYWNSRYMYYTQETLEGDLYPYKTNNALSDKTLPSFGLYNKNTNGTLKMGVEIKNIAVNDDGTVNFQYIAKPTTEPTPEGQIFYESFDQCSGTGGNDGTWSSGNNALVPDNEGWEYNSANGGYQCGKFGSSKKLGTATTPSFNLVGTAKVTFKAAPFNTDKTLLTLKYGDQTVGTFTMKEQEWTEFSATITGDGEGTLTFTPVKRFFLDEVRIVNEGSSNGIDQMTIYTGKTIPTRIYNMQGQYVGDSLNTLPSGIYIVGGRKVIK